MPSEHRNILVRMPNWIGDLVMATPILTDLRAHFPKASITAMCKQPLCELLNQDPDINELFCFTSPSNSFLRRQEHRNIIAKIKTGKFDTAVLTPNSFSSAWWCWQGNVPRRIGYSASLRRWLLTDPIRRPKEKMHQVDLYKKLLEPLSISHTQTTPRLYVLKKEVEESKQLLYQRGYEKGKRLIGINPGAAYGLAKCWPPERFRALALELLKDGYIVFFGDASTFTLVREICKDLPREAMNLAGVTSLRELACIIKDCDLLITNDSGPMHIATAFNTPLIALFGSTDEEATGPYRKPNAVINNHASCAPYFKRVCPIDFRCMKTITVEEVAKKARELLHV